MCKPGGLFNDTELKFLTRFPIVTIEKGQGVNETGYAEDKMIAAAKQIKVIIITVQHCVLGTVLFRVRRSRFGHSSI